MHLYRNKSDTESIEQVLLSSCRQYLKFLCFPVSTEMSYKAIFTKQEFHQMLKATNRQLHRLQQYEWF